MATPNFSQIIRPLSRPLIFGLLLMPSLLKAQDKPLPVIFSEQSVVHLEFMFNVQSFLASDDKKDEFKAILLSRIEQSETHLPVKISRKGNYRNDRRHCSLPGIGVNLPAKKTYGTMWAGTDKFRIVIPCLSDSDTVSDKAILEYIAYQIYTLVSPVHFKVRPAIVTLMDTTGRIIVGSLKGFIVEEPKEMAARHNGKLLKVHNIHPNFTEPESMLRLSIFEFLIGNTDWSVKALHNIALVSLSGSAPVAVPFDFDYSGLVDAPYAVPAGHLPISDVKERFYNGYCRDESDLNKVLALFQEKKTEIMALLQTPLLNDSSRVKAMEYLNTFYAGLEDRQWIVRHFIEGCRKE